MTLTEDRPIFQQIAEQLEEAILSGAYPEESQVPSITEYSVQYRINPATALKGINLLVDAGLLYKKRGVGMFVASGAREKLRQSRRAVEAGGKGLQVLWLLSRGFEGGAPPVGPLRGLPRQGRGVAGPQKGRRAVRTAQFEWYRGSLTAFVSKFFFGTKAVFSSPKSSSSSRKEHTP